jgi:hypothetical protein
LADAFIVTLAPVTVSPTTAVPLEERGLLPRARALAVVRTHAVGISVLAMGGWWLLATPRMWGGRDPHVVTVGAVLTAVALITTRPDRVLPGRVLWLAAAVSVGAVGVALLSPTGWAGASTAASYVCVAWTVVAVMAAVRTDEQLAGLLSMLVMAGVLVEFAESWLAWWGGTDASLAITGTFNWFDPFAAYLIAGTVIGFAEFLGARGPLSWFGLAAMGMGTVGIIYSTSRASLAAFAAAVAVVGLCHLLARGLRSSARLVAGLATRAASQSLSQNGGYRVQFWREAIGVFGRHPVVGGGYHSLAVQSAGHVPSTWAFSPLAHDGYLQALSDGGLLLGVPFLVAVLGTLWCVVSLLVGAVKDRDISVPQFVVPIALGAMLAHSLVDFDWSYPANFLLVAVLAGLVGARWLARREAVVPPASSPARTSPVLTAVLVGGVVLTGVAASSAWHGDLRLSLPISHSASHGGTQ